MFIQCLLIAIIYMLGNMDTRFFGANRWNWPICLSAIVGLAAGDLTTGIIMGVELQLIFMGFVNIGMSVMPDAAAGSTLAVSFAILSGLDSSTAIALAMPIALLFQPVLIIEHTALNYFNVKGDQYSLNADTKGLQRCLFIANGIAGLVDFALMFIALYAGSAAVEAIVNFIPEIVMNCLEKTATVLPALGLAYLMSYVCDKFTMPFLFMGFILAAYLGMDALAVSICGGIIAVIYFNIKNAKAGGDS